MREIKFRALQKISKNINLKPKMVYGTGIFKDPINTWLYSHDETNPMAAHMEYHIIDPLTIGQYTGLKDKNGVEIYEGDIMCYTKAGGHNSIGIVKYVNEFARWEYWHTTLKQGFPILSDCANMEVIGNIFEDVLSDLTLIGRMNNGTIHRTSRPKENPVISNKRT